MNIAVATLISELLPTSPLSVPCPFCQAPHKQLCKTNFGKERQAHRVRVEVVQNG